MFTPISATRNPWAPSSLAGITRIATIRKPFPLHGVKGFAKEDRWLEDGDTRNTFEARIVARQIDQGLH